MEDAGSSLQMRSFAGSMRERLSQISATHGPGAPGPASPAKEEIAPDLNRSSSLKLGDEADSDGEGDFEYPMMSSRNRGGTQQPVPAPMEPTDLQQNTVLERDEEGGDEHGRAVSDEPSEPSQPSSQGIEEEKPIKLAQEPRLEVLKEGWLNKQSKKLKLWQKRYFVLDGIALYYCRSPTMVPDGLFIIRKCQMKVNREKNTFSIIGPNTVMQIQAPEGSSQLDSWVNCYQQAMTMSSFPYFHVVQTTRLNMSRELILGIMSSGIRLVKLGLYDPGYEEEISFWTYDQINRHTVDNLVIFKFWVHGETQPYAFETMHAQDIASMFVKNLETWNKWKAQNQKTLRKQAEDMVLGNQRIRTPQ